LHLMMLSEYRLTTTKQINMENPVPVNETDLFEAFYDPDI
jgi:hypothetical protein